MITQLIDALSGAFSKIVTFVTDLGDGAFEAIGDLSSSVFYGYWGRAPSAGFKVRSQGQDATRWRFLALLGGARGATFVFCACLSSEPVLVGLSCAGEQTFLL